MSGRIVILAGGVSSRMKNSSLPVGEIGKNILDDAVNRSKGMIRLGENERPFLDYLLFNAVQAGYDDAVIVIGENDDSIRNYYESLSPKKIKISYAFQNIPVGRSKPLGTGDALLQALVSRPDWEDNFFTVCNSDNLYSVNALSIMLQSRHANAMIDYDRNGLIVEKERIEKFAVTLKDAEGFLLDIIEKPSPEEIRKAESAEGFIGVSMNIFKLNRGMILPHLMNLPLNPVRLEKELPSAIKLMITGNPKSLYCHKIKEHVPDLTSKNDILIVKNFIENNYSQFSSRDL